MATESFVFRKRSNPALRFAATANRNQAIFLKGIPTALAGVQHSHADLRHNG
jgi:hypothetical protein